MRIATTWTSKKALMVFTGGIGRVTATGNSGSETSKALKITSLKNYQVITRSLQKRSYAVKPRITPALSRAGFLKNLTMELLQKKYR
jgi:hypothetical protein